MVEGNPRQDASDGTKIELSPARPIAAIDVAGRSNDAPSKTRVALAACLTGIDERGTKWMDAVLDMLLAKSADDISGRYRGECRLRMPFLQPREACSCH